MSIGECRHGDALNGLRLWDPVLHEVHEINRMMDFLALQKAEHKKYKEKEARAIEQARERQDQQLRKNMTDCYPKHPSVF